jgi:Glycine transporter
MKYDLGKLLLAVDIAGTFLFGIEGAEAAIRGNLDLLGLMVLAFSTALAGGVLRDLLIGAVPPEAIRDWRYATTAFAAASSLFSLPLRRGVSWFSHDAPGCGRPGTFRCSRYRKSPRLQNPSVHGSAARNNHGSGWHHPRYFPRARSSRPAIGSLRHGRAGGSRDFACHPQAWYFADTCGDCRQRLLLCSPSRCRLFPLELAAHRESVVIWSIVRI